METEALINAPAEVLRYIYCKGAREELRHAVQVKV